MPRGMSRWGLWVSSAAVATMSNPMYAKKTTDAAAMTPYAPNIEGSKPKNACSRVWSAPDPASAGFESGTKG